MSAKNASMSLCTNRQTGACALVPKMTLARTPNNENESHFQHELTNEWQTDPERERLNEFDSIDVQGELI